MSIIVMTLEYNYDDEEGKYICNKCGMETESEEVMQKHIDFWADKKEVGHTPPV
jgi:uncharacterized Zn ribbon protein